MYVSVAPDEIAFPSCRVVHDEPLVDHCTSTYIVAPLAVTAIEEVAVPLEQLFKEVVALTDPGLQLEASIVIDESAVVLVVGSRKSFAVFSAYQLITTAAPLD